MAETPKHEIRIPDDRWKQTMKRARMRHGSTAAGVVNALLARYLTGELDGVVSGELDEDSADEATQRKQPVASGAGGGSNGSR